MDQNSIKQIDFVFHLEKAIENGEFEVFFQPIIHTISGSLCGFEALARWHHPSLGFLAPQEFLSSLEDTHQIHHLDVHVVDKVCRWYAEQKAAGRPVVPVSINLSRYDFDAMDIFGAIVSLTEKYGVPHNMLNIEITESALSGNERLISTIIERFRRAGFQVWMDDFGSGYSSLNTLKDHTFDELKIDMAFLSNMTLKSKRILRSIVSMAKGISMVTVMEGVETEEQFEFLKTIACDRMQGFYFAPPMPYDELLKVLDEKGIVFESAEDRRYYHEINRINLLSPMPFTILDARRERHEGGIPLAILERRGDDYEFIYRDAEFEGTLRKLGAVDAMDAIQKLVHFGILTKDEIEKFISGTISEGERELVFSVNGDLCSAHAKLVSAQSDRQAILLSITNITQRVNINHKQLLDQSLMNIYSMYYRVCILHPEKDEIINVFTQAHNDIPTDEPFGLKDITERFARAQVHKDDLEIYHEFLDVSTLEQRIRNSPRGFINTKIRTIDEDGEYTKKMFLAVAAGNKEVVLLIRYANL